MSELVWASNVLQNNIAPADSGQFVQDRIRAAARALRWTFSRTRDVWYADDRVSIKPRELRRIEEVSGLEYGRRELKEIDALIGGADALLMGSDPDFHGAFIAAARSFYRTLYRARAGR